MTTTWPLDAEETIEDQKCAVTVPESEKMGPRADIERPRSKYHGDPRFYALLDEIAELHSRKNHDYARTCEPFSNFRKAEAFGVEAWRGVLVRMSDKWARVEQLAGGKVAQNESLDDSLRDLAVYALIALLLRQDAGL